MSCSGATRQRRWGRCFCPFLSYQSGWGPSSVWVGCIYTRHRVLCLTLFHREGFTTSLPWHVLSNACRAGQGVEASLLAVIQRVERRQRGGVPSALTSSKTTVKSCWANPLNTSAPSSALSTGGSCFGPEPFSAIPAAPPLPGALLRNPGTLSGLPSPRAIATSLGVACGRSPSFTLVRLRSIGHDPFAYSVEERRRDGVETPIAIRWRLALVDPITVDTPQVMEKRGITRIRTKDAHRRSAP